MIAISNMNMPKTCWECEFALYSYSKLPSEEINKTHKFQCVLTDKAITSTKRNRFCPLIEIDEPKVGKWEECKVFDIEDTTITEIQSAYCPICHKYHTTPYMYYFDYFNYCPNCGAKMKGE